MLRSCINPQTTQNHNTMSSLGHSSVHAPSNQILQPIISGGANPPNAHFTNAYGSMVGGITGCGGAGGSAAALAGDSGYNLVSTQSGGNIGAHRQHRRGGYKKRSHKRCKCRGKCHCRVSKRCKCRGKCHCKSKRRGQSKKRRGQSKRRHRGGMASFSPASFSGPNPPYHQYGSNIPNSPVFSLGGALSPALSGLASPPPIDSVVNRCS
jgi:hypothetical protein